jgi:hypothetical protein
MVVAGVWMSGWTHTSRSPRSHPVRHHSDPFTFAPPHACTSPCLCARWLPLASSSLSTRTTLKSRHE